MARHRKPPSRTLRRLVADPIYTVFAVYVLAALGDRAATAQDPFAGPVLFAAAVLTVVLTLDAVRRRFPAGRAKARHAR